MKAFSDLYVALDSTTKTSVKVAAMAEYFRAAAPADAAWAIFFLSGRKLRQAVPTRRLAEWAIELARIEPWLFEECYHAVGDLAETIALLLPDPPAASTLPLSEWVHRLNDLRSADDSEQRRAMIDAWQSLDRAQRFIWNKLITGGFRVGVSQLLLTRALALVAEVESPIIAHRLMGSWQPTAEFYRSLSSQQSDSDLSRPYPFYLASPLEDDAQSLGDANDWQAEWKWDGIRSQLIKRGEMFLWSRGEELVTDRFPEISAAAKLLPDGVVIDGEILPWRDGVLPFSVLQRRIGRKSLSKKILAEAPVVLLAYDLLEHDGKDIRELPLVQRRGLLSEVIAAAGHSKLLVSPVIEGTWEQLSALRDESRARNVEGLMLKRKDSPYRVGRVRGDWWKWKIGPQTLDAVLVYAQRGSGKRASLYTDYTFALRDGEELVPFAKAYSGLSDAEIREVDQFIRKNTTEKFGPVRSVRPELVFELAFEGIQHSPRHKSGIAVRFPRILRQRKDKSPAEADTVETARAMITTEKKSAEGDSGQGSLF